MYFTDRVIGLASDRQSDWRYQLGPWCARCGKTLSKRKWEPVPRVSKEFGGRATIDNCILLCSKCIGEIKAKDIGIIPDDMIPFYSKCPPNLLK